MKTNYTKIYTGNFMNTQLIVNRLEDIGIIPISKDEFNTGLSAVLVKGYDNLIDIYVHNDELDKAVPIVETALAEMQT